MLARRWRWPGPWAGRSSGRRRGARGAPRSRRRRRRTETTTRSCSAGDEEGEEEEEEEQDGRPAERSARDRSIVLSDEHILRIDRPDARFFVPVGELAQLAVQVVRARGDVLFVNAALTPMQQRCLEAAMDLAAAARHGAARPAAAAEGGGGGGAAAAAASGRIAVFDRPRAVLAIFARRAASPLARLRVEAAEAQQAKAKLGAAALQGVSTQLERIADTLARRVRGCDRGALLTRGGAAKGVSSSFNSSPQNTRQKQQKGVEDRGRRIKEELARWQTHREAQRRRRGQAQTIALAGYTNVGKSAIVNRLTGSDLLVRDGVFVTMDVAARRVPLPSGADCFVLDSVGFVRDLPFELCDAFHATVEELATATLVLHVRDMSHPSRDEHAQVVSSVLARAGVDTERRIVEVWNKADLLSAKERRHFLYVRGKQEGTSVPVCCVSALYGDGFEELVQCIDTRLQALVAAAVGAEAAAPAAPRRVQIPASLDPEASAALWSFLRRECTVVEDSITAQDDYVALSALMDDATHARWIKRFGSDLLV